MYKTNTLSWICIVLAYWNNSPRIDMSSHLDALSLFRAIQSLFLLLNAAFLAEKQHNFKVLGLTLSGLEHTIYRTRDEHANHNTTDYVLFV